MMINQQHINTNNLNNNNNINNINNIPNINNINNNNNNRRNNNNINIHQNNRNNPNNNNNINPNQRIDLRIRERGPNVQVNANQINPNNERRNSGRYHQNNNNNIPNYNINYPNNLIAFNGERVRPRVFPVILGTSTNLVNVNEISDNDRRATDKEILNNLPETQIEDVSKLDSEKKNCVICLEDFKNKDKAIILPCIHLFHKNCINNWLKAKNKCPICKFKLTGSNIDFQSNNFQ